MFLKTQIRQSATIVSRKYFLLILFIFKNSKMSNCQIKKNFDLWFQNWLHTFSLCNSKHEQFVMAGQNGINTDCQMVTKGFLLHFPRSYEKRILPISIWIFLTIFTVTCWNIKVKSDIKKNKLYLKYVLASNFFTKKDLRVRKIIILSLKTCVCFKSLFK